MIGGVIPVCGKRRMDDEWILQELIPRPLASPQEKAMAEQELEMVNGVHVLRVRAALAGFVLRLWGVNCSEHQD